MNSDRCIKSQVCCGVGLSVIHQRYQSINQTNHNAKEPIHSNTSSTKPHPTKSTLQPINPTVSPHSSSAIPSHEVTNPPLPDIKPQLHHNTATMCKYYAHTHPCGHTKTVFAAFCPSAALVQRACAGGEIWATVKMEIDCSACGAEKGEGEYRGVAMVAGGARRGAGGRGAVGGKKGRR